MFLSVIGRTKKVELAICSCCDPRLGVSGRRGVDGRRDEPASDEAPSSPAPEADPLPRDRRLPLPLPRFRPSFSLSFRSDPADELPESDT